MYRLATVHIVTDRRTVRQTENIFMPTADRLRTIRSANKSAKIHIKNILMISTINIAIRVWLETENIVHRSNYLKKTNSECNNYANGWLLLSFVGDLLHT